ncbi:hypothetical protein ACFW96_13780 [Streptomyces gardneri]|uniref:hypothetical protein n=1 Tax=Streptomyces gardneri TaxID=66892 RepID=UPI0036928D46
MRLTPTERDRLLRFGAAAMARVPARPGTPGTGGVLYGLGAIGSTSPGAQGAGRAGETVRRAFAAAGRAKAEPAPGGDGVHDGNACVPRHPAGATVDPAIAHGLAHGTGPIEAGWSAGVVPWRPALLGAGPRPVLRSGFPRTGSWAIRTPPPVSADRSPPAPLSAATAPRPPTSPSRSWRGAAVDLGSDTMPTRSGAAESVSPDRLHLRYSL